MLTATADAERAKRAERLQEMEADGVRHGAREKNVTNIRYHADFQAFRAGRKDGTTIYLPGSARVREIQNALDPNIGSSGGFPVDSGNISEIIEVNLTQASAIRQVANVEEIEGANFTFALIDDGNNEGRIRGVSEAATETQPVFEQRESRGHKYASDKVKVPFELLDDAPTLGAKLFSVLGRRIARLQNRHFSNGTGVKQPMGLVPNCVVGVTAASATAIDLDEVIDLVHSVDAEYLDGTEVLMAHQTVFATLRKLADTNGQYLWEQAGLGKLRLVANNHMTAALTTGLKPLLFGNFVRAYTIRTVSRRLEEFQELYVTEGQTAFELTERADGLVVDAEAVKSLQLN